jgi:hypothetical protein
VSKTRFIYGLYDARTPHVVMVVGKTRCALRSLVGHIAEARRCRRLNKRLRPAYNWILQLLSVGLRPEIQLLATTDATNWQRCERRFITTWRKLNPKLLNVRDGGDGPDSKKRKVFCDKCGTRRKRYKGGWTACPKCALAAQNARYRTPKGRAHSRAYRRTEEARALRVAWNHSPKGRAFVRNRQRAAYKENPKERKRQISYVRDWRRTRKVGLTVAEYRKTVARN